jgi:hypothetical protein
LYYLSEALFDEAVQHLIDLLAWYVGPGCEFQCFETRVTDEDQVRPCLISVEADLLESTPEALEIHLGKFFIHLVRA